MKYHNSYFRRIEAPRGETMFLLGFATGRIGLKPVAKWLYSLRLFIGWFRFEILWTTREGKPIDTQTHPNPSQQTVQ